MPARKPKALSNRHSTRAELDARTAAESAMAPSTALMVKPPPELKGRKKAAALWKELVTLYAEVQGQIVTAFDQNILSTYCIVTEEIDWLTGLRADVDKELQTVRRKLAKAKGENEATLYSALNALLARLQGFDARLDGKRKLKYELEKSLYLTPRSRAGVAPPQKEPKPVKEGMEALLDG
jgi:hypothetical protein